MGNLSCGGRLEGGGQKKDPEGKRKKREGV